MKKYYQGFAITAVLLTCFSCVFAAAPTNFTKAKKIALQIFNSHRNTLYCQCNYSTNKTIDLASCNMQSADGFTRSHKMEWEHMMPASQFGSNRACWREKKCTDSKGKAYGGRKCCEKIDKQFQKIEGELYNLWPANGYINVSRSNFAYAQLYPLVQAQSHNYYGCPVVVDRVNKLFEPSDESKGIVARAMLFMVEKYHIDIDNDFYNLMTYWHRRYPPSNKEREWEQQVADITGYHNHYIVEA